MRPPRLLPLALAVLLFGSAGSASATLGLEQIRYALQHNPAAPVEADLRRLAARGDAGARRLLADVLAEQPAGRPEAIALYQQAFADGQGDISALGGLARLLERSPHLQRRQLAYVRQALGRFVPARDLASLATALDVFVTYPQLFDADSAMTLIALHQRSCLWRCATPFYRGVLAERQGDHAAALAWYAQAIRFEPRAVERYYLLLGEDRDRRFAAFARTLEAEAAALPLPVIHRIGSQLDSLANREAVALRYPLPPDRRLAVELSEEEVGFHRQQIERVSAEIDAEVAGLRQQTRFWLDVGVERGWLPALVSRLNFMTSTPNEHSPADAFALLERIAALDPEQARSLRAGLHLVTAWPTLAPHTSAQLIEEMAAAGHPGAVLQRANLYSHGGLGEPDQFKALEIYQALARDGSATAFYRMAGILSGGRAICRDPVRAYAYARTALALGDSRARTLSASLARQLPAEQIAAARRLERDLLEQLP